MNNELLHKIMKENLSSIIHELEISTEINDAQLEGNPPVKETLEQLDEWVSYAQEYGIAYESLVCFMENLRFNISCNSAIKLLEVGLLMRYKTKKIDDTLFDFS